LNERTRAVERVKHPAVRGTPADLAEFLAQNPMIRKGVLNAFAQFLFCASVGEGDRRRISLALNGSSGLKVFQGDLPCLPGGVYGEVEHPPKRGLLIIGGRGVCRHRS
jgi:hypothetical protein